MGDRVAVAGPFDVGTIITRFALMIIDLQGARKGLVVNSTDLCAKKHRVKATMSAQNGGQRTIKPLMRASCGK